MVWLLCMSCAASWAASFTDGDCEYQTISGGTSAQLTKYSNTTATTFAVPETATDGTTTYPVTSITTSAFSGCTNLKSLHLSKNITEVTSTWHSGLTALQTITLMVSCSTRT